MRKYIVWISCFALLTTSALAKENVEGYKKKTSNPPVMKLAAGCDPATASNNLDINNVRARIMNGGDMWWDLIGTAMYEVPKVTEEGESRKTALFAGALWIGGYDNGNNLRAAAMTYRQQSSWDFFPGPLTTTDATIDLPECIKWDKIFQVTREEIDNFIENGQSGLTDNILTRPETKVKTIRHNDLSAGSQQFFISQSLNRTLSPDRHKNRSLNNTTRSFQ